MRTKSLASNEDTNGFLAIRTVALRDIYDLKVGRERRELWRWAVRSRSWLSYDRFREVDRKSNSLTAICIFLNLIC